MTASNLGWESQLRRNKAGVLATTLNIALILSNDQRVRGVIATNEFSERIEKLRRPPYPFGEVGEWTDLDDTRLGMWIEENYAFASKPSDLGAAVAEVADRNRYHPVRDWLARLNHDGVSRLQSWMSDYLGAEDTPYTRLVGAKFLIMTVARVLRPGCKADNVMILEGRQGARKSSALRVLGGEWFTDTPMKIGDKESYPLMQGVMIVEIAELDALSKAEANASKAFFGQTENHYRPVYARRTIKVKRQCVFSGTVNDAQYLKDPTGGRRFWPVKVKNIDLDGLAAAREQLFAEALAAFYAGIRWWVEDDERALFEEQQEERYIGDAYLDRLQAFLESPEQSLKSEWSMSDFLEHALKLDVARWTRGEQSRVGSCLAELGMQKKRSSRGKRPWMYRWPSEEGPSPNAR